MAPFVHTVRSIAARLIAALFVLAVCPADLHARDDDKTLRVFIFAGQSNMVGSDSRAQDIALFPPFAGLEEPQKDVKFSYCIGREEKLESDGWVALEPVDGVVGPELSFARRVGENIRAPIAIIKCAAGGTHLGGDWNPDQPSGFELYPLALSRIRAALADLDRRKIAYRIEGLMWHQGENDMFHEGLHGRPMPKTSRTSSPVGGVILKTPGPAVLHRRALYQDDLGHGPTRDNMHAIRTASEARSQMLIRWWITSPLRTTRVEIGGDAGLHYHYGTLGQLEHGVNYADAYLRERLASRPRSRATAQSLGRIPAGQSRSSSSSSPGIATWRASALSRKT